MATPRSRPATTTIDRSAERSGAVGEQAFAGAAARPDAEQAAADAHRQQATPADRLGDRRLIGELVEQAMQRRLADGGAVIGDEPLDHHALAELCERVDEASGDEAPRDRKSTRLNSS